MNLSILVFGIEIHFCADEVFAVLTGLSAIGSSTLYLKYKWEQLRSQARALIGYLFPQSFWIKKEK